MKVKIISKEVIKPSSPTPTNLRNFKLSILDQLSPPVNGSLIYFFRSNDNQPSSQKSLNLKKSLSNTLTLYYPLAGKIIDNMMVDCNDNGALYIEAQVDIPLSCFLHQPDGHDLYLFLPTKIEFTEKITGFITLMQISFFSCGGIAVGLCIAHKLMDAVSFGTFVKSLAANMTGNGDFTNHLIFPVYEASALFPARENFSNREVVDVKVPEQRLPMRRLVFDSSKLATLKARFNHLAPSKSEIITAIIWKSAFNAARSNSKSSKHLVMCRTVNIRTRISPPLAVNSIGNIMTLHTTVKDEGEIDLSALIHEMRKGLKVFDEKFVMMLQTEEGLKDMIGYLEESARERTRDDAEVYYCSSLCNMSLYDVDFGWGSPIWATAPPQDIKNLMILMETNRGDGSVEAWVVLSEEDAYLFEQDPELLAYASLNPSIVQNIQPSILKSCI